MFEHNMSLIYTHLTGKQAPQKGQISRAGSFSFQLVTLIQIIFIRMGTHGVSSSSFVVPWRQKTPGNPIPSSTPCLQIQGNATVFTLMLMSTGKRPFHLGTSKYMALFANKLYFHYLSSWPWRTIQICIFMIFEFWISFMTR